MTADSLQRILDSFKLDAKLSWTETLSVTYPETIEADVEDDLSRELALWVHKCLLRREHD